MKKVIVTGGLGFIGSNLVDLLIQKNYFVINIDKVTYSSNFYNTKEHKNSKKYKFIKCDIRDKKIKKILFKYKPVGIFNLAAETHVDRSIDNPESFIQSNVVGVFNLLECFKEFSKKNNSNFLLKDKLKSSCSEFNTNNSSFRLFLPNTFMNNSGDAVRAIVDWYKVNLDQIFIIVDDKDLPLGKIRFRKKGSSGGHNGLKSIIEQLQTQNFNRIRIGIGSPPLISGKNNFNTISHVLGNISLEEQSILDRVYRRVIESLEQLNTKKEEFIINELNSFDKDQP